MFTGKFLLGSNHMDFVLTSDLDWASEYCVEHFLQIADRFSVKPTLFVTHDSRAARAASDDGRADLGIHPNFLHGSSHGETLDSVVGHVLGFAPNATAVRCHRYFDTPHSAAALARHGLKIDSNICLHLQSGIAPIRLPNGLTRFPVFFEDDVHWIGGHEWSFDRCAAAFSSSGLKILNFHPFFVALNVPDADFYARHKAHIPTLTREEADAFRHTGPGAATFLVDALEKILASGHRFVTLGVLAETFREALAMDEIVPFKSSFRRKIV